MEPTRGPLCGCAAEGRAPTMSRQGRGSRVEIGEVEVVFVKAEAVEVDVEVAEVEAVEVDAKACSRDGCCLQPPHKRGDVNAGFARCPWI